MSGTSLSEDEEFSMTTEDVWLMAMVVITATQPEREGIRDAAQRADIFVDEWAERFPQTDE